MAITQNNVQNVKFLRNQTFYSSRDEAKAALETNKTFGADGSALLARYSGTTEGETPVTYYKTLVGYVMEVSGEKYLTIFDVDDAGADVDEKIRQINAKLGSGITSANTATAQLEALSGLSEDTSASTSVKGAKLYTDEKISNLDYTGITTSNAAVVTNVTEADGIVAATSANVGNLKLTDYTKGSDSGSVAATDSINEAVAKLENQIDAEKDARAAALDALDASSVSGASKVVIDVTQDNGKITATAENLTGVKLDGYQEAAATGDVASTDTLGEALGKLQKTIHEMDKAADAEDGKVVTTVSEVDGVVSETKANVKDLQLGGYAKTNDTGDILSADTINVALSKLENKAAAITINNADGSINVTTGASGTDINVNIKTGEHVLAKDGNAGLYTNIALSSITPSSTTVKEEYQLTATDGTKLGDTIKIYKDSHIVSITYITESSDPHYQNLEYVYIDASGNTQTEYVDISSLVLEAEFSSGITVTGHIAHGVVDPTSEKDESNSPFLTVGADGFKVDGIKNAIDTKINKLDADISGNSTHVTVGVEEVDGKITAVTVSEDNIANADDLSELSGKSVTEIGSSNSSIAASIAATSDGTVKYDITTDANKIKMSSFTADTSGFTAITEASTVTEAVKAIETEYIANEQTTAAALTDLNTRLNTVSGDVDTIESQYVSGATVNGSGVTVTNHIIPLVINSAAGTGSTNATIVVETNASGEVTLKINDIDAGYYA